MCEILAPAGDEAAFFAALDAGADAIYLGLRSFSARANAANFTPERLAQLIRRAHLFGTRVHVALNTLVKEGELSAFFASAQEAWNAGADALIVQDVFLGAELKRQCPQLVLHLSTQAGTCNVYGARLAKSCGFSRVILARETPLAEIAAIAREIETEVFVQGALCTCFSGQCYLSSFAGGNSGNRGLCKQPCRKRYTVDRKGFERASYALSLADLSVGARVRELAAAGVTSFKIEGRMRSAAYVGAAVKYYKDLFAGADGAALAADRSALKRTYNRGDYTAGYAFGEDASLHAAAVQGHIGEKVGTIARLTKDAKRAYVRSSFRPQEGDGFKVLRGGKEELGGSSWRPPFGGDAGGFYLAAERGWQVGDGVYLTLDTALAARIAAERRLIPVSLSLTVAAGEPPVAVARGAFGECRFTADFCAEPARSSPLTEEELRRCFARTGEAPFAVSFQEVRIAGDCFVVRSALNAFRRAVFDGVEEALAGAVRPPVTLALPPREPEKTAETEAEIAVIDDDFASPCYRARKIGHAIFKPKNYRDTAVIEDFLKNSEYYASHNWLYLPVFMTESELKAVEGYLPQFYGVYGEGVWAAQFCKEKGLRLFAGVGFNLFNSLSAQGARAHGAERLALSKELSVPELTAAGAKGSFVLVGGGVKVMDLIHCPFGRSCADCDQRRRYTLTDEAGRQFPLLRYETSVCRFELYNPSPLAADVAERLGACALYDFTGLTDAEKDAFLEGKGSSLPHTAGAFRRGIN